MVVTHLSLPIYSLRAGIISSAALYAWGDIQRNKEGKAGWRGRCLRAARKDFIDDNIIL